MVDIPYNDPEKKKQEEGQPQAAGGMASSVQAPSAPSQPASTRTPSSGRFVNLQRYLGANTGAGQRLAGEIGQTAQKQQEQTNKATQATSAVQNQIQAEKDRIAQASGYATQITQDPTKLIPQAQQQQAPLNPNGTPIPGIVSAQGVPTGNPLEDITKLRTGVTRLGDINQQAASRFDAAQSQLGQLQALANRAGTESGRFELLRQSLGRPTYTTGQQSLDQLLLQSEGGGSLNKLQRDLKEKGLTSQKSLDTAKAAYAKGTGEVTEGAKEAQKTITGALGRMDDPTTAEDESTGALGSLEKDLSTRRQEFIKNQGGLKDALNVAGSTGQFSEQLLNLLTGNKTGAALTAGQQLFGVNINDYITPTFSADNITNQNIANQADYARYKALAQLAGINSDYLQKDQLDKALESGLRVDTQTEELQRALQNARTTYDTKSTDPSIFGDSVPKTVADLNQFRQNYESANWLNQFSDYLRSANPNDPNPLAGSYAELAPEQAMFAARQEQARRLSVIDELLKMNPDRRVTVTNGTTPYLK